MFEDSMLESGGRIKTKSKYWMIATFSLNGAILAALIIYPLINPEALPKGMTGGFAVHCATAAPTSPSATASADPGKGNPPHRLGD